MTKEEVTIIIQRLRTNFYNNLPENFEELKKEWAMLLLNHDFELVTKNFNKYLEECIYFPKFANLVKKEEKELRTGPYIPGVEETQKYIEEMKKYEEESCSKETAMKYLEKIRKVLDR